MSDDLDPDIKALIDSMSYEDLLRRWRFGPVGDKLFVASAGNYYSQRMRELQNDMTPEEHTIISKRIGWDNG